MKGAVQFGALTMIMQSKKPCSRSATEQLSFSGRLNK